MRSQRGFTLLEVVVAFAVFALTAGALYESLAGATRHTAQARAEGLAMLTAQSALAGLRSQPTPWPVELAGRDQDREWHLRVEPFALEVDEASSWRAYQVTVSVRHAGAKGGTTLESIELARTEP